MAPLSGVVSSSFIFTDITTFGLWAHVCWLVLGMLLFWFVFAFGCLWFGLGLLLGLFLFSLSKFWDSCFLVWL